MSKKGKIVVIGAVVLIATGAMLFIFGQDKQRKKAYNTSVPPEYAKRLIKEITGK